MGSSVAYQCGAWISPPSGGLCAGWRRQALHADCRASNEWPGMVPAEMDLVLPAWAIRSDDEDDAGDGTVQEVF